MAPSRSPAGEDLPVADEHLGEREEKAPAIASPPASGPGTARLVALALPGEAARAANRLEKKDDAEELHGFRVGLRRLRSTLRAVWPRPEHQLLGGPLRDRIRVYSWIGGDRPADTAAAARDEVERGFTAVKMNATVSYNAFIQEPSLRIHYNQGNDLLEYVVNRDVFAYRDGFVRIPQGPGLGIEIDEDYLHERVAVGHRWRNPVWRHADGSFAEW
jgi:hypothetical protein